MSLKNLSAKIKIPKLLQDKLKNNRINKIYKRFEKTLNIDENYIVAVSGGPDSMALAFLAKIYALKKKLTCRFFIVDHKLRAESSKEAKVVKKVLKQYSIDAQILTWYGKKPLNNVQSLARKKRYELLINKSDQLKISNILLGHHSDDLLENFFIRILRGSGLKGLVSFGKKSKVEEKNLLRPLLDQKKEDLLFISKYVFNFFVEDPSNNDEKYQRTQIRELIKLLQKKGLDKEKFSKTINNLKSSNEVVDFYVEKNFKKNTFFSLSTNKLVFNKTFFQQPYEVVFRGLSKSIRFVGGRYYSVRGKKLDKIIGIIENNRNLKVTLGGCIIKKVNQTVIISKEY